MLAIMSASDDCDNQSRVSFAALHFTELEIKLQAEIDCEDDRGRVLRTGP
jgi:hypothetical protein